MTFNKYYTIILFVIIGCQNTKTDQPKIYIHTEYYETGEVKQNLTFSSSDSLLQGLSTKFYRNKNKMSETYYKDGKKDSTQLNFFESGEIKSIQFWQLGLMRGEFIEYWEGVHDVYYQEIEGDTVRVTGPMLKSYIYYGENEMLLFERLYTKSGLLKSQIGISFEAKYNSNKIVRLKDEVSITYYLANPPWVEKKLTFKIWNEQDSLVFFNEFDAEKDGYNFRWTTTVVGEVRIEAILKLQDILNENQKIDTLYTLIYVKERSI